MNYLSKVEAKKAVLSDGKNICNMSFSLRDDDELAWLAIEHGASINDVSYRLQNDLAFSLKYARYCAKLGIVEQNFFRALFIAQHSLEFLNTYCSLFANEPEFIMYLKLAHGKNYRSPIVSLNKYEGEELAHIINQYKRNLIKELKEEYYSHSYQEMYLKTGYKAANELRNFALLSRGDNLPFCEIPELIKKQIERLDTQVDCLRATSRKGSFPERVIDAILKQLNVAFDREVVFQWSRPNNANKLNGYKRYDFYLPEYNAIIEVHGAQHYSAGFETFGGRSLKEEQANDHLKQALAKQNDITNYIVINAAVSNFYYIKESVISNKDFSTCFDLSKLNWHEIKIATIEEPDISLPLYQLQKSFYEELSSLFNNTFSVIPIQQPSKDFGEGCSEETSKLTIWKKSIKVSMRGLYPHEIILLERAKRSSAPEMTCPVDADNVIGKWYYEYGISNVRPIVERLADSGFIQVGGLRYTLQRTEANKLKQFASKQGIKAHGKKEEIIARILENIPEHIIKETFTKQYYELTELGKQELNENSYIFDAIQVPILDAMTRIKLAQQHPDQDIYEVIQRHLKGHEPSTGCTNTDSAQRATNYDEGDKYQIICTLDKKTCERCGSMDLKVFDYAQKEISVTYPPFHDGCRCCAVPYFDGDEHNERAARNRDGKTIFVENMNWQEWRKVYGSN